MMCDDEKLLENVTALLVHQIDWPNGQITPTQLNFLLLLHLYTRVILNDAHRVGPNYFKRASKETNLLGAKKKKTIWITSV